jgi:CubicO group peptidase (beta-lactamase class C family)
LNSLPLKLIALAVVAAAVLNGCASLRVDKAAQVATGLASHLICDDTFITGLDPETAYAERVQPLRGMGLVNWALRRQVDTGQREVTVSVGGLFESRARYRDGLGCVALPVDEPLEASPRLPALTAEPALLPEIAGPGLVQTANPALAAALARAIAQAPGAPPHRTKAVVVLHDGRLVAETYAPGFGIETPVLGFSMTKSVTSALIGILVRQGRLSPQQAAPLPQWRERGDPRHAITVDHLLRHTSGLDLLQDNSGFDSSTQIMYSVRDKAASAAAAPLATAPGTRWAYADTNYILLSRILRDSVGGSASDVLRFARHELFGPLGMRQVTLDFDATGTPVGASHMLASARDWARFAQLYLDDGVVAGRRILPEGWVQQSATPTLQTGYGAGFWSNRVPGNLPNWAVPWGLASAPADTFFARGFMGQAVVVIPSRRLVIVRLSVSHVRGDDIEETDRIVGEVLAALRPAPSASSALSTR